MISGDGYKEKPPIYKTIGILLALLSGLFIGSSFVLKKKGLLAANLKDGREAGEGYGYLKNWWWWAGMTLMIVGEICNFAAYLFVEAILVTPLGALSVVVTAILSTIFLKERLSFIGKIGCIECIIGSCVIVINAPKQAQVSTIQDMQDFAISPGFLAYTGTIIVACICIVIFAAPRWGNQSMMVYLSICSLFGGLSVACIQGIGAAIIAQANGIPQFNQWFTYVLIVFVIVTLLVEIVYLNKALNIFNAAIVTPTYYVFFTSATIVTSAILFRGFKGSASSIATVCMGFLQICAGVILLQLSKSAKNVPDTEVFRGDLDQVRTVAEQEEPEYEPKADAIRGTAAIIRRISMARQEKEAVEAHRILDERFRDTQNQHLGVPVEDWDGLRRRVTWGGMEGRPRRNTLSASHPPLGLTRIPDIEEGSTEEGSSTPHASQKVVGNRRRSVSLDAGMAPGGAYRGFRHEDIHPEEFNTIWSRTKSLFVPKTRSNRSLTMGSVNSDSSRAPGTGTSGDHSILNMADIQRPESSVTESKSYSNLLVQPSENYTIYRDWAESPASGYHTAPELLPGHGKTPISREGSPALPSGPSHLRPGSARQPGRQFSFQHIFTRAHRRGDSHDSSYSATRRGIASSRTSRLISEGSPSEKTEEELLGLVKGDQPSSIEGSPYKDTSSDSEGEEGERHKGRMEFTVRGVPTEPTTKGDADNEKGGIDANDDTIRNV